MIYTSARHQLARRTKKDGTRGRGVRGRHRRYGAEPESTPVPTLASRATQTPNGHAKGSLPLAWLWHNHKPAAQLFPAISRQPSLPGSGERQGIRGWQEGVVVRRRTDRLPAGRGANDPCLQVPSAWQLTRNPAAVRSLESHRTCPAAAWLFADLGSLGTLANSWGRRRFEALSSV